MAEFRDNIPSMPKKPNKSATRIIVAASLIVLVIIVLSNCFAIVYEAEQAVVSRFGVIQQVILAPDNDFLDRHPDLLEDEHSKLKGVSIQKRRGLQFKIPFVTEITRYNARQFTYLSDSELVNTADKKQYYLTIYAQWQIANPGLFAVSLDSIHKADPYLDNIVFPAVVQNVNRLTARDFIGNKDKLNETLASALDIINREVRDSGIEFKDIQIFRSALPAANIDTTYQRMVADRTKVAQQLRSEGQESYNMAVAQTDLEARKIEAAAISDSERIKGEADAEALAIYAQAYQADPEFYTYWRSLKALEASLGGDTTVVLDKDHPLWKPLLEWAQETKTP